MKPAESPIPPDFELLFGAAPGLLLAVEPDDAFHIAAASDTYLRATMTRREGIVGQPIFEVFPDNPDDPSPRSTDGLRATLERVRRERALATMPVYRHDIQRPEAEGGGFEQRFWQTSVWPVPAEAAAGPVRYLLCRTEDVTERTRGERNLSENEERLRMAIESAQMGTFDFDPQTGELNWSDTFRAMLGVPLDETVSYQTTFRRVLHPEDRERTLAAVADALRPGGDGRYQIEYRVVTPAGVERWIAAVGSGFFDAAGQPRRFIGTALDITERKRAEQAAERRSEQLKKLAVIAARLNSAHDVRSVLGILTEEARQLIGARQSITQAEAAAQPLDGQPLTVVSRPAQDGPVVEPPPPDAADALTVPLVGRNGQPLGVIQLTNREDQTFDADDAALLAQLSQIAAGAIENARLYEELRGNDRRKDEFLAMLAHELRNPLSAILNAVALGSDGATAEEVSWSMEVIQRQLRQLTRLIDDLLDVSRITRGKVQLRKELLDASHVLHRAVEAVRGLVEERRHKLTVSLQEEALPLEADPARLEQIFVNLLNNAARYTDHGGEISLRAGRENGHVVIRVKDNGLGIPPEKLSQMFELFAQGDRALARSEGGLGVGLTIVRSLAEMHGGTVHAHSEGAGMGSEFVVRLPVATAAKTEGSPAAGGSKETPCATNVLGRALVVDDNVDSANGTARILRRHGYEARVAYDGPDAVELAREYRPRFVLLDIGLPGMDGYEVARRLRENAGAPGVKIIAVSGYGQESDRRRSREAGFDHHLVKPVDPDKLLELLRGEG